VCFFRELEWAIYDDPNYNGHTDSCGGNPALFMVLDDLDVPYFISLCYDCLTEEMQEAADATLS